MLEEFLGRMRGAGFWLKVFLSMRAFHNFVPRVSWLSDMLTAVFRFVLVSTMGTRLILPNKLFVFQPHIIKTNVLRRKLLFRLNLANLN